MVEVSKIQVNLSATLLNTPYNLRIIRYIIEHWPQSTDVCDNSGNSILHLLIINRILITHQEGKNLLTMKEFYDLRNCRDHNGNTPLHIAASNMDIDMVQVIVESGTNLDIINMEGVSATSVIQQHNMTETRIQKQQRKGSALFFRTYKLLNQIRSDQIRSDQIRPNQIRSDRIRSDQIRSHQLLYLLLLLLLSDQIRSDLIRSDQTNDFSDLKNGALDYLQERMRTLGIDFLHSQDPNGQNILHKLMKSTDDLVEKKEDSYSGFVGEEKRFCDFVRQVLSSFPALLGEANVNGDTPIHVLMRTELPSLRLKLLEVCNGSISEMKEEASINGVQYDPPWIMQNADGNTPLHEALIRNHKFDGHQGLDDVVLIKLVRYDARPLDGRYLFICSRTREM
ncbi:Ankyrin repeat domain-containing protein 27, partial [Bienertia sinuspersici]